MATDAMMTRLKNLVGKVNGLVSSKSNRIERLDAGSHSLVNQVIEQQISLDITINFNRPDPNPDDGDTKPLKFANMDIIGMDPDDIYSVALDVNGRYQGSQMFKFQRSAQLQLTFVVYLQSREVRLILPGDKRTISYTIEHRNVDLPNFRLIFAYTIPSSESPDNPHFESVKCCTAFTLLSHVGYISTTELHAGFARSIDAVLDSENGASQFYLPDKGEPAYIRVSSVAWQAANELYHEWGHYYISHVYNFAPVLQTPPKHGVHTLCQIVESGFALSEGYADAFSIIMADIIGDNHLGQYIFPEHLDDPISLEKFECDDVSYMRISEGWVAAALWDLYDDGQEENNGAPYNNEFGAYGKADARFGDTNGHVRLTASQVLEMPLRAIADNLEAIKKDEVNDYWSRLSATLRGDQYDEARKLMCYNFYNDDCD